MMTTRPITLAQRVACSDGRPNQRRGGQLEERSGLMRSAVLLSTVRALRFSFLASLTGALSLGLAGAALAAGPGSQTFSYTGSEQTYTVPAGVTAVNVTAVGAPGGAGLTAGGGAGGLGADGAQVTGTLAVTPARSCTSRSAAAARPPARAQRPAGSTAVAPEAVMAEAAAGAARPTSAPARADLLATLLTLSH